MRPTQNSHQNKSDPVFGKENLPTGSNHIERGVIILCDAARHSYRVALNGGRSVACNRLKSHPNDHALLPVQTKVAVSWALGAPYIIGVLPEEVEQKDENPETVTDTVGYGGQDPVFNRNLTLNGRAPGEPNDVLPGDQVLSSGDGASAGVLLGKIALLKGSPLAKILALGNEDLIKIVAGIYSVVTWMGESKVINNEGKTSYVFRGGSDQLTQSGPDEERYTIKFDLGATGDILLFELTNHAGQAIFRLHINSEGSIDIYSAGFFNYHSGQNRQQRHATNYQGNVENNIDGDVTNLHNGNITNDISGKKQTNIKGSASTVVEGEELHNNLKNIQHNINENYTKTVGKDSLENISQTATRRANTINEFSNNIVLGEGATSHGTKYEELKAQLDILQNVLNQFIANYNLHIHPVSGSSTGVSSSLVTQSSNADFSLAKSSVVKMK